jgi:hypothetical protein
MSQPNESNSASVQDAVLGADSDNFFDDLDRSVNKMYDDDASNTTAENKATPPSKEVSTSNGIDYESEDNPYKKRYSDSSREAQKLAGKVNENSQYDAIINVMKKDPQLVGVVKDYLEHGPKERSLKEEMNIPDDFAFDPDEAFANPDSPSAKVFNSAVDRVVNERIQQTENKVATQLSARDGKARVKKEAEAWMQANNVSEKDFTEMMKKATQHKINYDDIYLLMNKDKVKNNIANSTKKGMAEQMKNIRSVPQTASGTGSADVSELTEEDRIFTTIKNMDDNGLFDSVDK